MSATPEGKRIMHRLAVMRQAAGISQAEIARRMGVTKASISRWEAGLHEPTVSNVQAYCRALGFRLALQEVRE